MHILVDDHPDLPEILANYVKEGVLQKDMPQQLLDEHKIDVS
jgi:hypothetical protein